jgi:hypothetical protein
MLERADGTLLEFDRDNDPVFDDTYQGFASADKALIESYRESEGGHLVEMVPAKPKVPVSQEEADMLEKAKNPTYRPSFVITEYSNGHKGGILGNDLEDRLIRAYVDGYTVVESTKYNVKVPHTREVWYYKSGDEDLLTICPADKKLRGKFTESEIKHYGLEDCERVEINTEDSDDN